MNHAIIRYRETGAREILAASLRSDRQKSDEGERKRTARIR
jgi:hypothetical protein